MKKIFSFLTAILFAGSMMATDVAVTIYASSGDYYAKTHSWVSGSNSGPAYDQVVLDEVITANRIGTGNNGKYYTDWRFYTNGSDAGSFSIDAAEGYELQSVTFTYTVSNSGALYMGETKLTSKTAVEVSGQKAIFQCKNTNTSTNGQVRLTAIAVTYQAAVAPLTTVKTVYCKNEQAWWFADGATVGIYAFADGDVKNAAWPGVRMEAVAGEEGLWKADIDTAKYAKIIFTRVNATGDIVDWGAKTADLTVPADKNLYTITSTSPVWGDPGVTGEWSVYSDDPTPGPEPPTPATLPVVALAGTMNAWAAANMTAADDSLSASIKVALEAKAYEFKIVSDGKWLSLNGEGESLYAFHRDWTSASHINGIDLRNFELTADVAGEYTFTWTYADSTLTITFPAKPQPVDDKIIFDWTKGTGAKVEADKTDLNANNMGTMTIGTFVQARLLGTNTMDNNAKGYKMGNNDVCVEIQGTKAFAVGDTVIITGVCGGSGARAFAIAPNTTINAAVDTALTNTQENTSDILEYKVIVKEAQAGDTMRIFRQAGKSMYLYSIKVVRPSATPEPPVTAKYYVTGDSALVTDAGFAGKAWNPDAIKAEADTLVLNLKAEQVYKLKVTLDGTWNTAKGFNNLSETPAGLTMDNDENIIFSLAEAGAVKVIYTKAVPNDIFKLEGNFYVEPTPVTAKYYVTGDSALVTDAGFAGKAWDPAAIKAEADTLVLNLKANQDYVLKVVVGENWLGYDKLTEKTEGLKDLDGDNHNIGFKLTEAGAVKVIYIAGETPIFKLIGNFYVDPTPVVPTAAVTGDMTKWGEPIPFELSEDSTFATLYNDNIKKGTYAFKMIINGDWRSNGYEFHRGFPGCAGITGNTEANMTVVIDVEGAYTFKWYFANDSLAIIYPEKPEPAFKDGFYLVGKFGGVDAWGIDANKIFTSNPSAEGEYMLENVTLAEGDSLKVVWVENDAIKTWYPDGANYGVDTNHAGVKTIYFRADGQGGEDWFAGCIYIAPNKPTAITNVNADAKAVKSLKNGILMIEKDGKVYNVIGLQIR